MTLSSEEHKQLQELLDDAERCPRLSDWQEMFLADMRGRVGRYGADVRLSDKQREALKTIEGKVYASG